MYTLFKTKTVKSNHEQEIPAMGQKTVGDLKRALNNIADETVLVVKKINKGTIIDIFDVDYFSHEIGIEGGQNAFSLIEDMSDEELENYRASMMPIIPVKTEEEIPPIIEEEFTPINKRNKVQPTGLEEEENFDDQAGSKTPLSPPVDSIMMSDEEIAEIEANGEEVTSSIVDDGEAKDAGVMVTYKYDNKNYNITTYNNRAINHASGDKVVS